MSDVVQKLWGFCHTLRHDGIDYGDYIEQITYLLFLKMADERGIDLAAQRLRLALRLLWPAWRESGTAPDRPLHRRAAHARQAARHARRHLRRGAVPRFNNPVNLKRLISLIDETEWTALDVDVKAAGLRGAAGEGGQRGQEGRRAVLHAAPADPVDRPLHEARPARRRRLHASATRPAAPAASSSPPTSGSLGETARRRARPRRRQARAAAAPTSARSWSPARGGWR